MNFVGNARTTVCWRNPPPRTPRAPASNSPATYRGDRHINAGVALSGDVKVVAGEVGKGDAKELEQKLVGVVGVLVVSLVFLLRRFKSPL